MKIGIKVGNEFGNPVKEGEGEFVYKNLFIENIKDLNLYAKYYLDISSEKVVNNYMGYKSQEFRKGFGNYVAHESEYASPESKLLGVKLEFKEYDTSFIEFSQMSDDIMFSKIKTMGSILSEYDVVRVNNKGGYCSVTKEEMESYDALIDPTEKQIANFINVGEFNVEEIEINNKTVVIENSRNISSALRKALDNKFRNYQVIGLFKAKLIGMEDKYIHDIFLDGYNNGMRNICFETTGQDQHQMKKMAYLYETLKSYCPDLKLYIKAGKKTKERFEGCIEL